MREVIASIKGTNIYSTLKYESGVHRVQRVPDTETQGRVHTSAATVAVLPEAEEVDLKINESDLRIDVFRAGGPEGNQSILPIVQLESLIFQQGFLFLSKMRNLNIKTKLKV